MTTADITRAVMDHILLNLGRPILRRELVQAVFGNVDDFKVKSSRIKDVVTRLKVREHMNFDMVSVNGVLTVNRKGVMHVRPERPQARAVRRDPEIAMSRPAPHPMAMGRFYGSAQPRFGR